MALDPKTRERIERESGEALAAAVRDAGALVIKKQRPHASPLNDSVSKTNRSQIEPASHVAIMRRADEITPRELEPLWPGVLWIGKPTLFTGDPGLGKSLATTDIAARVTNGTAWPGSTEARKPGRVLMMSGEDDAEDTQVPRLLAAGAVLERITFLDAISEEDGHGNARECPVSLDVHMDVVRNAVISLPDKVELFVIDPISAFLGKVDSHNNAEIRTLLAALGRLAAELRFSVLVISHLNKVSTANAIYRVTGSLAFVAAARSVFAIVRDPDEKGRRLILPIKSNLGPDTQGYRYTIKVSDAEVPYICWSDERESRTADEILSGTSNTRDRAVIERRDKAQDWLAEELSKGERLAADMELAAKVRGISERSLRHAKKVLQVRATQRGFGGVWVWSLPSRTP